MALRATHWLGDDGRVLRRIREASETGPWLGRGEEQKGPDSRAAVQRLQEALLAVRCSIPSGATGVFGDQTAAAVRAFQTRPEIHLTPDGIAGKDVLKALDDILFARESGAAAPPAPMVYTFLLDGRRYRTEGEDLEFQFRRVIDAVQNRLQAILQRRRSSGQGIGAAVQAVSAGVVRGVSDALGQASMPSTRALENGVSECLHARRALARHDDAEAAEKIGRAIFFYELAKGLWEDYLRGTISGAERARVVSTYLRDGSFAVFTSLLTGGVTAEIGAMGLVRGALTRAIVTGTTGMVVGGATTAVRELTTFNAAALGGVEPDVNWPELASTINEGMVTGLVSSLISGGLASAFSRVFPVNCSEQLLAEVNAELRASRAFHPGTSEIPRFLNQSTLSRVAGRVLASIPQSALVEAVRLALQQPRAHRSFDEFVAEFQARLPRQMLVRAIAQAVIGAQPPPHIGQPSPP